MLIFPVVGTGESRKGAGKPSLETVDCNSRGEGASPEETSVHMRNIPTSSVARLL